MFLKDLKNIRFVNKIEYTAIEVVLMIIYRLAIFFILYCKNVTLCQFVDFGDPHCQPYQPTNNTSFELSKAIAVSKQKPKLEFVLFYSNLNICNNY